MWIAFGIIVYVLFWLCCIAAYAVRYLSVNIHVESFSQVLYTLNAGSEGAENTIAIAVGGFFKDYWLILLIGTAILAAYLYFFFYKHKGSLKEKSGIFEAKRNRLVFRCSALTIAAAVVLSLTYQTAKGYEVLGIGEYLSNLNEDSMLYDDYFVEPSEVNITFKGDKKNLIVLVLESMETSYTSRANGGGYAENLIPGLYDLAKEQGNDFSASGNTDLNGGLVSVDTHWTVGGLVAMSAGLTLNVGHEEFRRNFDDDSLFMPHITTLGEILEDEGYSNYFLCGSPGDYAGRSNYFSQHGNYKILDEDYAKEQGWVDEDYHVWWGYEDDKLYEFAKQEITEIAKSGEPFNFTMLTEDTHFPDGYPCDDCPDTFDTQYKNVINCADTSAIEFIGWLQEQDFWEDTVLVITGDHLSMDGSVPIVCGEDYQRKVYFNILNGPEYTTTVDRSFTTMDIFPTTLEAMGAKIEGHRLGLGTSLYSDIPTIVETIGFEAMNTELSRKSDYYYNVILQGDQSQRDEDEEQVSAMVAEQ